MYYASVLQNSNAKKSRERRHIRFLVRVVFVSAQRIHTHHKQKKAFQTGKQIVDDKTYGQSLEEIAKLRV